MKKLTAKQQQFVAEYLIDLNATQAAIRAGYSVKTACSIAGENMKKPDIQKAIQDAQQRRAARTEITQDAVLKRFWAIATANPNEVIQFRRVNCRYCWGVDHYYQWTKSEYHEKRSQNSLLELLAPDCDGGFDFDCTRAPHPDCPECKGEGIGEVFISDTAKLTGAAALLYASAKAGKYGIEVHLHDQVSALIRVGQHLGMFKDKVEHTGKDGGPIETQNFNINMTETEADKRIVELQSKLSIQYD